MVSSSSAAPALQMKAVFVFSNKFGELDDVKPRISSLVENTVSNFLSSSMLATSRLTSLYSTLRAYTAKQTRYFGAKYLPLYIILIIIGK